MMKGKFYKILAAWLVCFVLQQTNNVQAKPLHPFFVSVTEMNFNAKSSSLEISCKMFADDIQNALKQNYRKAVDLSNTKQEVENGKLLSDYFSKHLSILSDSKIVGLKFIGFEVESESVYCYFEASNVNSPKKVMVTNKILQDYKQEQVNIMHVVVNGNRKSTKTDFQSTQATLSF